MNILICCAGGMSSSLLVQKMRDEVKKQGLTDYKIGACAINQLNQYLNEADVLLIAPQISFISSQITQENLRILHITPQEYGTLNASSVISRIISGEQTTIKPQKENKFIKIQDLLLPIATKVSLNKTLNAIAKSFISIMPITMIGSLYLLLENLPFEIITNVLKAYGLHYLFDSMSAATIDILSIYLVFFVAYHYVKLNNYNGHPAGLLSLISFFIITGKTNGAYQINFLGTKGVFCALFIGITVSKCYVILSKFNITKKLDALPKQVAASLSSIIPFFIIISIFTLLASWLSHTNYGNLHQFFYITLQKTLSQYLGNNIISFVFFQLTSNLLWFFGIHGGNVVNSVTNTVYIPLAMENFALYSQGEQPIHIITNCFAKCFTFGGAGSMFGLSLLMTFFSKSEQYKTLGRISLPTTFFYINEPLLFGIPVIMNPLYFIPLMLITPILGNLTYFMMKIGIIPIPSGIQLPWTTPPIIYGILQGGWILALWEVLMIIMSMIMWYPFFKVGDKEAYLKEHNDCHN